ncbi:MAG: DUF169 domain-containing protein [Candidatus Nezhaarchaeales archaeon]
MSYVEISDKLFKLLKLETTPVAIKLLKDVSEAGDKVRRPRVKLAACQIWNIARFYGWVFAGSVEDMACAPGAAALGFIEVPPQIASGEIAKARLSSLEVAKRTEEAVPRLKPGTWRAMVAAPLERATFTPDVVLIYASPAQALRLSQGYGWRNGDKTRLSTLGEYACAECIAQVLLEGKPFLVNPCYGERRFGLTRDYELCFSTPPTYLQDIIVGLEKTHEAGWRYPIPYFGVLAQPYDGGFPPLYRMDYKK